jgi:hypothetical protein
VRSVNQFASVEQMREMLLTTAGGSGGNASSGAGDNSQLMSAILGSRDPTVSAALRGGSSGGRTATEPRDFLFELLIAELKLLDRAGELTDRVLEPVDAHREVGGIRTLPLLRARGLAAAEQIVEQAGRVAILRQRRCDGQKHAGGKRRLAQVVRNKRHVRNPSPPHASKLA